MLFRRVFVLSLKDGLDFFFSRGEQEVSLYRGNEFAILRNLRLLRKSPTSSHVR